jgi:hypothetical protein
MTGDADLRDRLRKIEALFAGAGTPGEKAAAGAAAERIRSRLDEAGKQEAAVEVRFSLSDPWSRRLFIALCRRYGLRPFRYPRMQRQTIILKAPRTFVEGVLWPEFTAINAALTDYLAELTDTLIREEVYGEAGEADEVPEPRRLAP